MAELEGLKRAFADKTGQELMIWTSGGHYFRGDLHAISDDGYLILRDVSCTLAGERHERETVYVSADSIDALS